MKYTDEQLTEATKQGIFADDQVRRFKEFVQSNDTQVTKFQKLLYYGGGLLIISALTWLMTESWQKFGWNGVTAIASAYLAVFLLGGYFIFFRKKLEIAGGMLFSVAIAVTPLLVFAILKMLKFWPQEWDYSDYYVWVRGKWIILEISVIVVALPILLTTKFPFHVFLIAGSLWFFSMDIVPIIYGKESITWTQRAHVSMIFGVLMIAIGYFVDIKFKKDYAFWMYLFGLLTLSSGLSIFYNDDTLKFILLGAANVVLILFSLFINRNVFIVFGTIGLGEFLSRLSWEVFKDSLMFPFALTAIGVLLIVSGIYFQKNRKTINEEIVSQLPKFILDLRPKRGE